MSEKNRLINEKRLAKTRLSGKEKLTNDEKKKKLRLKQIALYNIQIKRRGKFRTVRTGLTKEQAIMQEQDIGHFQQRRSCILYC